MKPPTITERLKAGQMYFRQTGRGIGLLSFEYDESGLWLLLFIRPHNRMTRVVRGCQKRYDPRRLGMALGFLTRTLGKPATMIERWIVPGEKPVPFLDARALEPWMENCPRLKGQEHG